MPLLLLLHSFNGLFSRTTWVTSTRKVNHSGFYWSKRWWGGSSISWTICKSFAPHSRQITMPVPQHSVFTGRMPFLPPNQQRQSTEGILNATSCHYSLMLFCLMNILLLVWQRADYYYIWIIYTGPIYFKKQKKHTDRRCTTKDHSDIVLGPTQQCKVLT